MNNQEYVNNQDIWSFIYVKSALIILRDKDLRGKDFFKTL